MCILSSKETIMNISLLAVTFIFFMGSSFYFSFGFFFRGKKNIVTLSEKQS